MFRNFRYYLIIEGFEVFVFSEVLEVTPELHDLFYRGLERQIFVNPLKFNFGTSKVPLYALQLGCESCFLLPSLCNLIGKKVFEVTSLLIIEIDIHLGT